MDTAQPSEPGEPRPWPEATAAGPAAYANHFEVGFNAFEFLLDFAQGYAGAVGLVLRHTRIITAPAYAKAFHELLERSLDDYEATFGPIPGPEADWRAQSDGESSLSDPPA